MTIPLTPEELALLTPEERLRLAIAPVFRQPDRLRFLADSLRTVAEQRGHIAALLDLVAFLEEPCDEPNCDEPLCIEHRAITVAARAAIGQPQQEM